MYKILNYLRCFASIIFSTQNNLNLLPFLLIFLSCFSQAEQVLPQPIQLNTHLQIDDEPINPETWKEISLVAKGSDSDVQIYLLRPTWWIEQIGAIVGETIELSMPEMGVNGPAKVLAIMPTKADSSKNTDPRYKPVTGKFVHDNAEVINLYFTHQETEPLGVTPNHLLWSVTHGGWMHAGDLKFGDTVKTKNGTETLTKKENKPGRHQVYNLEVHQSHTYYVSNIGVLAHNEYTSPGKLKPAQFIPKDVAKNLGYSQRISPQKAPFNSHGQPVFYNSKTKQYITPDIDSHNVTNGWKVFNRKFKRVGTYNSDLSKRIKD